MEVRLVCDAPGGRMEAVSAKSCDGGGGGALPAAGVGPRLGLAFFGIREAKGFFSDSGGTPGEKAASG